MSDVGLTHVALHVADLERSLAFYERYGELRPVHVRSEPEAGVRVAWISDRTRPFVIVLLESRRPPAAPAPFAHLGVGCASRAELDRRCALARAEGCLADGPQDSGPPLGYWAFLRDPDGHVLELSVGQEVGLAVAASDDPT